MKKQAKGVRVKKEDAEHIRELLIRQGLLVRSLKPSRDGDYVCFPVQAAPKDMDAGTFEFEQRAGTGVPMHRKVSFDVVGDIALIELVGEMSLTSGRELARELLSHHSSIRAVYGKKGVVGEFRIPSLVHLAGEQITHTTHRESGCTFELDVAGVYFNPRLATERARVEDRIGENDTVFDMFAGVGPFSILMAKRSPMRSVYAAEKNPVACGYLRANIKKNRVENVHVFEGDVRAHPLIRADAIIMNLPHSAHDFLDVAMRAAGQGAHIFCYTISPEQTLKEQAARICSKAHRCAVMRDLHVVKSYAPGVVMACIEMVIREKC
ncbi:MAG: class I SAM-dependent methyltransferase [Methermicoccaceae archaeon]